MDFQVDFLNNRFDQKSKSQIIKEKGHSVTQVYPILEEKVSDSKIINSRIHFRSNKIF